MHLHMEFFVLKCFFMFLINRYLKITSKLHGEREAERERNARENLAI